MSVSHVWRAVAVLSFGMGMLLLSYVPAAAVAPTWVEVGAMSEPRRDHAAVTLVDGRVLVASSTTTAAELWDPATRAFASTGSLNASHGSLPTATRLNDGRVLIVGGANSPSVAELYDPVSGTFSLTGDLNTPRHNHSATLLTTGEVLIAGGQVGVDASLSEAEVYSPATGLFSPVGSLIGERTGHTATPLANGSVLIAGGLRITSPGSGISVNTAELYDPLAESFIATGGMTHARTGHTASVLPSGDVLVAGGPNNTTEIYGVSTGEFSPAAVMSVMRSSHTASRLPGGEILLTGGVIAVGPVTTATTEIFDPVSGDFQSGPSMSTARQQHVASVLASGNLLVSGGVNPASGNLPSAELYEQQIAPEPIQGVIDFEGGAPSFDEGSIVDVVGLPEPGGVRYSPEPIAGDILVSGLNPFHPGQNAAMIFDSTCAGGCSGGDGDLRVSGLGNVLIVSEDLNGSNPGDLAGAHGQALSFDFSAIGNGNVFVESLVVIDVEPNEQGRIELFSGSGELLATLPIPSTGGNNASRVIDVGINGVNRMEVVLGGSGAIDNIRFVAAAVEPPPPPSKAFIEVSQFHREVRAFDFKSFTDLDIWVTSSSGSTLTSTTVTTDASGGADWESSGYLWADNTVHASDGATTKTLLIRDVDLGFWDGGTIEEYVAAASGAGAALLRASVDGQVLVYVIGAPDFVNQAFVEAFPGGIPAGAEVEIGFRDADDDLLLVIPFKIDNFAGFSGSLGHDFVCAGGFFAGPQVTLTILDGPGGPELASVSRPRSEDTICWTFEDTGVDLQPGMRVEVTNGVTTRGDDVFQQTLGSWLGGSLHDYTTAVQGAGAVTFTDGTPAEGLTTWVIGAPQFVNQAFIDAHPDGFDPSVVEVQAGHAIRYAIFDDALTPVLLSNEPPASTNAGFQAFVGADYVCAFNYPTGFDLTLIVNAAPGGSELARFTKTTSSRTCWTEAETGIDLEAGMEVLVTNSVTVKAATLLRTSLGTWTGGTFADYVAAVAGVGAVAFHAPDPTSTLVYVIGAPDFVNRAFVDAHPGGFDPSVIEVEVRDSDEDSVMFPLYDAATALVPISDAPPPSTTAIVQAFVGLDYVCAYDFPAGFDITLIVRSTPGGSELGRFTKTSADPVCWLAAEHGIDLLPGVEVLVTDTVTVKAATLIQTSLGTWTGGTLADYIAGATGVGASAFYGGSPGSLIVYVIGAPDFVNTAFVAAYPGGFDPTVIEVEVHDGDGDRILFPLYDAATALVPTSDAATATGPAGPAGPTGPAAGTVPVTPLAGAPVPAAATFLVTPPASGLGLTVFSGGTIGDLEVAAATAGGMSVVVTADGRFVMLIVGAPYWVNGEFAALFEAGVPSGQAVLLIIR